MVARVGVHLANARLTLSAHRALDVAGRFLLAIDPAGQVVWSTPQAAALLEPEGAALPAELVAWSLRCGTEAGTQARRRIVLGGRALELAYVGRVAEDEILLRVSAGAATDEAEEAARLKEHLGLTAREAEVLLWLARGKANRDIAAILGLSPRTVNKHLESIYDKLGIENRASAAALVVRALQGG